MTIRGMTLELQSSSNLGATMVYNNKPVMVYKTPNVDKMLKDLKIFIEMNAENPQEITPEFEKLLIYNIQQAYMKYVPAIQEDKARKGKTSITCPCCNNIAVAKGMIFRCESCRNEFDIEGNYTHSPWKTEPTKEEMIECTTHEAFNEVLTFWKDHVVYSDVRDYLLDTLLDIQSYFQDKFNATGYRNYRANGNEKGKTTACQTHSMLAYRAVICSRPTPAFVLKLLEDQGVIILDQAEDAFYQRNEKTEIYNIFTSGHKKGIPQGKLSAADHQSYDDKSTYGFKCYNQQDDGKTDNPINSRTWITFMNKGVPKIKKLAYSEDRAKRIRFMLYYLKDKLEKDCKEIETNLDGRAGDMYDPLMSIIKLFNLSPEIEETMYVHALEFMDKKRKESDDTLPAIIVEGISATIVDNPLFGNGKTSPKSVTEYILNNYADRFPKLTSIKVGIGMGYIGLKQEETKQNGQHVYDLRDPDNLEIFSKTIEQYKPTGIKAKIEELEKEFEKMGVDKINLEGTEYQRYYRLKKYKELIEKIHEDGISASDVVIPYYEDEVPPEHTEDQMPHEEDDEPEQPENGFVEEEDLDPENDPHLQI
ncbi:MAG: hypothetical protein OIN86_13080 [Candidatus Methanoperedens sp.]|nr:hypothetical protein [Candidatus Methanoperedens sp.]CAG0948971.1 hypothetical protein METP1_00071 [Methanosarcinales archaeon]